MSSNIRQNADNALQTDKISQKSSTDAEQGGQAVNETVKAMKEIAEKNLDHRRDRPQHQPSCPQRRDRGCPGRRGRKRLCRRCERGFGSWRKRSPDRCRRDQRALRSQRRRRRACRRDAAADRAGHQAKRRSSFRRSVPRATSRTAEPNRLTRRSFSSTRSSSATPAPPRRWHPCPRSSAGQAEQLQRAVSFFKMSGLGSGSARRGGSASASRALPAPARTGGAPAHSSHGGTSSLHKQSKSNPPPQPKKASGASGGDAGRKRETGIALADDEQGISLDLGPTGNDDLDADFEEY
jgi:methyl-accepting chemotaxis protein